VPSPKLLAVITALMLVVGAPGVQAAYTKTQLGQIEQMVLSQDWVQLRDYILASPTLLEGDDDLVVELRKFLQGMQSGVITASFGVLSPSPAVPSLDVIQRLRSVY
jgi:hypothetical protein